MLFFGKLQEYVSRILTNNCVADRFKNEFVIPCEVKDGATGTRVAQLPKALVAERYLIMRKTSVLTFLEMSNSLCTNHEFSRRNPKEVSKVPEKESSLQKKKEGIPERHRSIRSEGKIWETMCRGLERKILIRQVVKISSNLLASLAWKLGSF